MRAKRSLAVLAALCVLLSVCAACGQTHIEAYDSEPGLDFERVFRMYEPDTVVFTVDGEDVTWRELFYQIKYFADGLCAVEGTTLRSWDQICTLYVGEDGVPVTYGSVVLQQAVTTLVQYHAVHKELTDVGAVLGEEARASVEDMRRQLIEEEFGGDEQGFRDYLESMFCTEELWLWFAQVDALYAYDGFAAIYGPFGERLPDEEVLAYAAGDPDGLWTEYVEIRQLELRHGTADDDGDVSGAEILAALDAAEDKLAAFDALYKEHNDDPSLDPYMGGRCVYDGDVDDTVYHAAQALAVYGYTAVESGEGETVILRLPLDPDAGVAYDEETGTMYTLRYYAAWQTYSGLINGDDGWIATADTGWADAFEDFNLRDAFA